MSRGLSRARLLLRRVLRQAQDEAELRRADGLPGTLGVTALAAVLPGSGYLWTGRRRLGLAVLVPWLLLVAAGLWYVARDLDAALDFAFDPARLRAAATVLGLGFAAWVAVVATTYLLVRPLDRSRTETVLGAAFVVVLCLAVASPVVVSMRYATVQADLVTSVFQDNRSATRPQLVTREDPWGGRERVNILLLGGDGNVHRDGVRTDSITLVSIDTSTGRTVMFSLPRNLMYARFPKDSPLHKIYPNGYRGEGDPATYMLNAVYGQIPAMHPGILGKSANEGADAVKHAVSGTLGVPVHYYILVNLAGFREIVDAMGGVTVNINEPIPIGGQPDLGVPPEDYLDPGPDQHLNGFQALWYARGRYGSDDYERMERQRCVIDAIIDEARPLNLLRRYERLAAAGKRIVRTDVPSELVPAFVDLAMKMKRAEVRSVVFRSSDRFFPGDPDFRWMRRVVRKALAPPQERPAASASASPALPSPSPSTSPTAEPTAPSERPGDPVKAAGACAYHPEGQTS